MTTTLSVEPAIDAGLPIIDTHHHLYDKAPEAAARIAGGRRRYLLDEFLADVDCGHNVVATVYVDADAMYRADGPREMRVVGEVEFANGQAAMSASGIYGPCRVAAAIVGRTDCRLGDRARAVLEAQVAAGNGRFRGIRQTGAWDADASIFGGVFENGEGLYLDAAFRRGFAHLARLGLSFDAFVLAPQLPDVISLARAFPDTRIVLDHAGGPIGIGPYRGRLAAMFPDWSRDIRQLAASSNVTVKLGGLGSFINGFASYGAQPPVSSSVLAEEWRPYIETCIEAFGVARCMFESNYPVDFGAGAYGTIWNAFNIITANYSVEERLRLFSRTAIDVYRMTVKTATVRNSKFIPTRTSSSAGTTAGG